MTQQDAEKFTHYQYNQDIGIDGKIISGIVITCGNQTQYMCRPSAHAILIMFRIINVVPQIIYTQHFYDLSFHHNNAKYSDGVNTLNTDQYKL